MGLTKKRKKALKAINARWGRSAGDSYKSTVSQVISRKLRHSIWLKHQFHRKRRADRYHMRGIGIISIQHLGELVRKTSEHTKSCGGICFPVDEERCGLGSKTKFVCDKCLYFCFISY